MTELTRALRDAGHEVRIVGPAIDEASTLGESSAWVRTLKRRVPKSAYELLELGYSAVATARLLRAALAFGPDAIYERYNLHLHAGRFVARLLGKPLLLEVNSPLAVERAEFGGLALPRLARWSERSSWRAADHVLPVTGVLADHVRQAGVPPERILVVPNGVDLREYAALPDRVQAKAAFGFAADTVVLGFVGFVRAWHGLARVLEFADRHRELPLALLIVGDGPDARALVEQAAALGLGDRVRVTGTVPRRDVVRHVAAFDIALQPAVTPWASPLKLFEYLAAGCAVIAPDLHNIREVLTHEREALLFDPARPDGLIEPLARLCQDAALRRRLGEAARALVVRHPYTWHANAQRVAGLVNVSNAKAVRHA